MQHAHATLNDTLNDNAGDYLLTDDDAAIATSDRPEREALTWALFDGLAPSRPKERT